MHHTGFAPVGSSQHAIMCFCAAAKATPHATQANQGSKRALHEQMQKQQMQQMQQQQPQQLQKQQPQQMQKQQRDWSPMNKYAMDEEEVDEEEVDEDSADMPAPEWAPNVDSACLQFGILALL